MSQRRDVHGGTGTKLVPMAWLSYEAAQGPFYVVLTFALFGPFFSNVLVGDSVRGQELWGYYQAVTGAAIALVSPFLGAHADAAGPRKPLLALFAALGLGLTAALWLAEPGTPGAVMLALVLITLANMFMEFASTYHNALLPNVASDKRMGVISGSGYAVGWIAGLALIAVWSMVFQNDAAAAQGDYSAERLWGPLIGLWGVAFALPFFMFVPDQARTGRRTFDAVLHGVRTLLATFRSLGHYRNLAIFLGARAIYYDGVIAAIIFATIYATGEGMFDWSATQVSIYTGALLLTSIIGAFAGGVLDDLFGSKRTIMTGVGFYGICFGLALGTSPDMICFVPIGAEAAREPLPLIGPVLAALGFDTRPEQVFLILGMINGTMTGPALASSRTLLSRIAPREYMAQFFGLFQLTGRATAFTAPLLIGIVTRETQSQRLGLVMILVFLAAGWLAMLLVREERAAPHSRGEAQPVRQG